MKNQSETRNRVISLTRDEISRHFQRKMKVVNQNYGKKSTKTSELFCDQSIISTVLN